MWLYFLFETPGDSNSKNTNIYHYMYVYFILNIDLTSLYSKPPYNAVIENALYEHIRITRFVQIIHIKLFLLNEILMKNYVINNIRANELNTEI